MTRKSSIRRYVILAISAILLSVPLAIILRVPPIGLLAGTAVAATIVGAVTWLWWRVRPS